MKTGQKLMHRSLRICLGMHVLSAVTVVALPETVPDFSGRWKQDNERCQPKRSSDVTLQIEHHAPELTLETSISRGSLSSGHAVQRYTIGGAVSVSTGADGDEFRTAVVLKDSSLFFTIEEHEAGRILHSQEAWSLIENGAALPKNS